MANASKAVDSARNAFSKRGGMLRTMDALRLGIHPRTDERGLIHQIHEIDCQI
jgi:hypothetical protein